MNEEEAFQAALDANPDDWQTRGVFADWLEERGDVRAEGYRALGVLGKYPSYGHEDVSVVVWDRRCPYWVTESDVKSRVLPLDWYDMLVIRGKGEKCAPDWAFATNATRRECEDAAALAFSKLPAERRKQLLDSQPAEVTS